MNWKSIAHRGAHLGILALPILSCADLFAQVGPIILPEPWKPVVNRNDVLPENGQSFESFTEPSVNRSGAVAFGGTSGGVPHPIAGVFLRRMGAVGQPIETLLQRGGDVAAPNNVENPPFSGQFAGYRMFPWFPRIDADAVMVTSRGTSGPVWRFLLPNGEELFQGTSGVFATSNGSRFTAANMLGDVRDPDTLEPSFPEYSVPNEYEGTAFDGFPGSPAMGGSRFVTFKGAWRTYQHSTLHPDYTEGLYARDLEFQLDPLVEIVTSDDEIPMPLVLLSNPHFEVIGSPSSSDSRTVFLGTDDANHPHHGGIFLADLAEPVVSLVPLVQIGDHVPGLNPGALATGDDTFTQLGETLSFNGRWVAFWGSWGHSHRNVHFHCPEEWEVDDAQLAKCCHHRYGEGFEVDVPSNQGIFVYDTDTGVTYPVSLIGDGTSSSKDSIESFVYWKFSGTVLDDHGDMLSGGNGHDDGVPVDETELADWRMSTYAAVESAVSYGGTESEFRVAFKAIMHQHHEDTIFMAQGPDGATPTEIITTGALGSTLDLATPEGARIVDLAMERDSLRDGWFVIAAKMWNHDTHQSWAGVYASGSTEASTDFNRDGFSDIFWHSEQYDRSSFWAMNGLEWNQGGYTSAEPDPNWVGQFTADLDGDRAPDIIWRNPVTGVFYGWLMDGNTVLAEGALSDSIELTWKIVGVGDLNHDGRDDIVFMNEDTKEVRGWLMDGLNRIDSGFIGDATGLTFLGIGDLDADRHFDLLWQREDGVVEGWRMFGLVVTEQAEIGNAHPVAPNWKVVGMADLNGDLRDDLIWQDPDTGWVAAWMMNGLVREDGAYITLDMGPGFKLIAARDLDQDGHADMVWRDVFTGDVSGWLMNGFDIVTASFIRSVETYWESIP